ncbi:selenocysteine insertion sequence-binding protein 2-like [Ceratitis capitata]|uniref:selenocysteine insertion sequence-binding protein 2-like n=1 Tax=Ceratitis capitata TaxID=7213 RepID=UPI00032976FC|nr:selenocysteine insertion sequence-binding protein 2-like [Ceratitis capitata]
MSTSEKLHVIDRKTFDDIKQQQQKGGSEDPFQKIKNAKFRKKSTLKDGGATFNLLHFLTKTSKQKKQVNNVNRNIACKFRSRANNSWKKRGKTKEGGKRKKYTKLKKAILRYRQQKKRPQSKYEETSTLTQQAGKLSENEHNEISESKQETVKNIHSRRFRSYCDNCTTPILAQLTEQLLRELDRFQKRALTLNAIKAHAHRRFVVGFREAKNFLLINKVKLIIIATDCEKSGEEDGLDTAIHNMKKQCQQLNIPYLFALRRRQLAYALFKKAPIGCVAVLDYDGAREIFLNLLENLEKAKKSYEELSTVQVLLSELKINSD